MIWVYFSLAVLLKCAAIVGVVFLMVPWMVYAERKVMGWMQIRSGPSNVGKWGLLQPVADGIKMFFKEDITPREAFKPIYLIAPSIVAGTACRISIRVWPNFPSGISPT